MGRSDTEQNWVMSAKPIYTALDPKPHSVFFLITIAAGEMRILIGDGALNYRPEKIFESYYSLAIQKTTTLTFDLCVRGLIILPEPVCLR